MLQKTRLGWIVSGATRGICQYTVVCNFSKNIEIQEQLSQFWKLEEICEKNLWLDEERTCEIILLITLNV